MAEGEDQATADPVDEEPSPWEALPAEQPLSDAPSYLRPRHRYCLFRTCQVPSCCSSTSPGLSLRLMIWLRSAFDVQYASEAEVAEICPGLYDEDH